MDDHDDGRRDRADAAARPPTTPAPHWFLDTLELASDLVLVIDHATTILWANAAVESILGYSRPDILGRSFAEFIHADDLVPVHTP